jgi:ubiquitin-conjugating enzyme E2 J1
LAFHFSFFLAQQQQQPPLHRHHTSSLNKSHHRSSSRITIMPVSPSLRRIQADIRELAHHPSDRYSASPLEHDMFEWHFTIAGPIDSEFAGGKYHGRILLPPDYPFKPPNIIFLTKSGRFETQTKVCLSFSAFHPELWQPAWGIRLILEALIAFLPTPADGAIGSLNYTIVERQSLAKQSVDYFCPVCQKKCSELLQTCPPAAKDDAVAAAAASSSSSMTSAFAKEIEALKLLQQQQHANMTTTEKEVQQEDVAAVVAAAAITTTTTSVPFDETTTNDGTLAPDSNDKKSAAAVVNANAGDDKLPGEDDDTTEHAVAGPPAGAEPSPEIPVVAPVHETPAAVTPPRAATAAAAVLQQQPLSTTLDPYLHAAILLLSVIVGLLLRKIQLLVDDLNALDDHQHQQL